MLNRKKSVLYGAWIATLCTIGLLFNSCDHSTAPGSAVDSVQPLPALHISWNQDNSVVCFGTSLTYGFRFYGIIPIGYSPRAASSNGVSDEILRQYASTLSSLSFDVDSSYPSYLGKRLKIRVYNEGYVGASIGRALELVDDSVLSKKPALVLLEFGANDFLQGTGVDTAEARMNRLVEKIVESGSTVVLISFINPDMIHGVPPDYPLLQDTVRARDYFAMLNRVAQKNSIEIVTYPLKGIFGDARYMSDLIHPNGLGYMKMEENISAALMNTYVSNGMLR